MAPPDRRPSRRRVLVVGVGVAAFGVLGSACAADGGSPGNADAGDAGRSDRPGAAGPPGGFGSPAAGETTGTGEPRVARVPAPAGVVRTSWSTDSHTLGSYSYLAVGATPMMRAALAAPVHGVLWFAGEATSTANPSTVHGAQQSGADAAEAIAADADGALDVVVVGAGVAGARAARDLQAAGHRVVVVEAEATTGGRTRTVRPEGWPVPVELGASWVHDADASDLADELDALGVATSPFAYDGVVLTETGERVRTDALDRPVTDAVEGAIEWAGAQDIDRSVAAALEESGATDGVDPAALDHLLRTEVSTEFGADAGEISAWWGFDEGTEGDDLLVTGGYDTVAEHDLTGIDSRLGWVVESVVVRNGTATVTSAGGQELRAGRVVVTASLGVLKAGSIRFDPPLPADTRDAIESLGMGVLDKVWLRWDEPWWTQDAEQWTLVTSPDEPYVEWCNLLPATGAPVLLGLVGGAMARTWAGRTEDEVVTACLRSLQAFADAGW